MTKKYYALLFEAIFAGSISISLRFLPFWGVFLQSIVFFHTFTNKETEEIPIFPFKKQVYTKKIIGVASVEHGLGTTHIALTLANYLCSKLGMKTAYIELNPSHQIQTLISKQGKPSFLYKGIVFYPNTTVTSLPEILRMDYRYFILDIREVERLIGIREERKCGFFRIQIHNHCKAILLMKLE